VKGTLAQAIPDPQMRAALEKTLPNEALVALAYLDQHYMKKYGQSDQNIGDNSQYAGKTLEEIRGEAQKLMASPEYRDVMHKDHKATREKADNLYKHIAALTDASKKK
jgi:hypothetical protein